MAALRVHVLIPYLGGRGGPGPFVVDQTLLCLHSNKQTNQPLALSWGFAIQKQGLRKLEALKMILELSQQMFLYLFSPRSIVNANCSLEQFPSL